jgi:hypothetical protein
MALGHVTMAPVSQLCYVIVVLILWTLSTHTMARKLQSIILVFPCALSSRGIDLPLLTYRSASLMFVRVRVLLISDIYIYIWSTTERRQIFVFDLSLSMHSLICSASGVLPLRHHTVQLQRILNRMTSRRHHSVSLLLPFSLYVVSDPRPVPRSLHNCSMPHLWALAQHFIFQFTRPP